MRRDCAWCGTPLGSHEGTGPVTHGICSECEDRFFPRGTVMTQQEFLDRLPAPVLVVDGGTRVVGANRAARELLGKSLPEIEGRLTGEAIECPFSEHPDDCGQRVHCKSCVIRRLVLDTHASGSPHDREPATQDFRFVGSDRPVRFQISTEKRGGCVLLRVEELREAPE